MVLWLCDRTVTFRITNKNSDWIPEHKERSE
jgi:hypothetical protein